MTAFTDTQASVALTELGFRIRTANELRQAVGEFQGAWLLGTPLKRDEVCGPLTTAALKLSVARKRAGQGSASPNFSFHEFACKCGGKYTGCRRVMVRRELLIGLEALRARHYPGGLSIVSGYRCPDHNRACKGATSSMHLHGAGSDVEPVVPTAKVRALGVFSGVGYQKSTGRVRHVDTRGMGSGTDRAPQTSPGPPAATPARPAQWVYTH